MEGTLCAEDYTFIWKNKLLFKDRIFYNHSTIIAVKRVHIVIDRVSHILMRDCRWDIALTVNAPTANINCYWKENFNEELEEVFNHFPTYHMQILLGCCKAKYGREDRFKPTTGKDHIIRINQTLEKKWEYKGTVHQLFIDFKKTYDLFRRKVVNNILIQSKEYDYMLSSLSSVTNLALINLFWPHLTVSSEDILLVIIQFKSNIYPFSTFRMNIKEK